MRRERPAETAAPVDMTAREDGVTHRWLFDLLDDGSEHSDRHGACWCHYYDHAGHEAFRWAPGVPALRFGAS